MNRYNKLKEKALSVFASADGEWLKPNEAAERLDFVPRARPGPTSKDCGDLACLNGVRGVEVHWNIGSAREEWHGFGGCVRTGIDDLGTQNSPVTRRNIKGR